MIPPSTSQQGGVGREVGVARERDKLGRFTGPRDPDPGPFWIEAPTDQRDWHTPGACNVVDVRRPNPDPLNEGGKGFEVMFVGTFSECYAWIEAADADR